MTRALHFIEQSALSPELAAEASREAMDLWHNPEKILDICNVSFVTPTDRRFGRRLHVKSSRLLGSIVTFDDFSEVYPALSFVLDRTRRVKPAFCDLQPRSELRGFTINYLLPGQGLDAHVDPPNYDIPNDYLACMATTKGEGEVSLREQHSHEELARIHSQTGDIHGFYNPGRYADRLLHPVTNTGSVLRITMGMQIPASLKPVS